MPRRALFALLLLALTAPAIGAPGWQAIITQGDRDRLHDARVAWREGLAQARAAGFDEAIAREGALLDPDGGHGDPALPDGAYRCRILRLGRRGDLGPAFSITPETRCRIEEGRFAMLDGGHRPSGRLWPFDPTRLIFLGTLAIGDEASALPYGRDRERDLFGLVERIDADRWRLTIPSPRWEARIEVIEIARAGG